MSIKSLTITEDAYDALKALKHNDESFSEVILRISKEKRDHIEKYFGILKDSPLTTEEWIDSVKKGRKDTDEESRVRQKKLEKIWGTVA
ncbi:antitoxin VapB family protein [Candidatus Woesearchaeota archaeon]|nr:antitoxin VapB family protein [Candidatus Woesearchaeota archaeon]